jgi:hypothetical protein
MEYVDSDFGDTMSDYSQYDLTRIQARPLYFGLLVNVIIPVGLLFGCYYISNNQILPNKLGDSANAAFYTIIVIAAAQSIGALWCLRKSFTQPMVKEGEPFEESLIDGLKQRTRPVFLLIASVSLWGYAYILLTGRFNEGAFIVLLSFLVFQLVRPRLGSIKKLIDHQRQLVDAGQYRS